MRFTVLQALGQNIAGLLTFFGQTLKNNSQCVNSYMLHVIHEIMIWSWVFTPELVGDPATPFPLHRSPISNGPPSLSRPLGSSRPLWTSTSTICQSFLVNTLVLYSLLDSKHLHNLRGSECITNVTRLKVLLGGLWIRNSLLRQERSDGLKWMSVSKQSAVNESVYITAHNKLPNKVKG